MAEGRTLSLGRTGSRAAGIGRTGARGASISQNSFAAAPLVPPIAPPPPSDLEDPRNSNLIGDWL